VALRQWHPVKSMPKLLRLLRCRHWLLPWQPEQQQQHQHQQYVCLNSDSQAASPGSTSTFKHPVKWVCESVKFSLTLGLSCCSWLEWHCHSLSASKNSERHLRVQLWKIIFPLYNLQNRLLLAPILMYSRIRIRLRMIIRLSCTLILMRKLIRTHVKCIVLWAELSIQNTRTSSCSWSW
jgi:hypothetical protein